MAKGAKEKSVAAAMAPEKPPTGRNPVRPSEEELEAARKKAALPVAMDGDGRARESMLRE